MLRIEGLSVAYGGLKALVEVDLEVSEGEFVTIVGPNGAGKTTLFKTISGTVAPVAGRISYRGQDLLALPAAARAHLGMAHVPEGRQVFKTLSVDDNLQMGAYVAAGRRDWVRNRKRIMELFPVLDERRDQLAGTLSGGEQQMLAIARGLAGSPHLLMLDEPSMGLAPTITDAIFERIRAVHKEDGLTILLVEQRVAEALESCDRGYLLDTGRVALHGSYETLLSDARVKKAYLGM
ncbi:MAG: ABC transporter ATP-binding protein [Alphaproteobacteria bacterium]|nr:ABC transporter ATP-binding protein [Alphaproteobacteria bacterium]